MLKKNDRDLKFHERKDAIDNRYRMPTSSLRLLNTHVLFNNLKKK